MLVFNVDDDSDDREIFLEAINAVDPHISCVQFDSGMTGYRISYGSFMARIIPLLLLW